MDFTERPMKGKTAVVTGATSGMGRTTAEAPARLAATVALKDLTGLGRPRSK